MRGGRTRQRDEEAARARREISWRVCIASRGGSSCTGIRVRGDARLQRAEAGHYKSVAGDAARARRAAPQLHLSGEAKRRAARARERAVKRFNALLYLPLGHQQQNSSQGERTNTSGKPANCRASMAHRRRRAPY